jgi:hypothetical protein
MLADIKALHAKGMSDYAIAKALGLGRGVVHRARRDAGLSAYTNLFQPTPEQIEELRTTSNRAMTRKYGKQEGVWARLRIEYGIKRFRAPTTGRDAAPPKQKVAAAPRPTVNPHQRTFDIPPPDTSLAGEAARFLRTERWIVVNREKVYGDKGWNVGNMRLDTEAMISMAVRRGFIWAAA